MYRLAAVMLFAASETFAHDGHGLSGAHLHGWDYVMLCALVVLGIVFAVRGRNK